MEYEDRRDADDAYHEMHNKRIGRDDVLKIEVSHHHPNFDAQPSNMICSGLARLLQLLGVSTLVVIAIDVTEPVVVALLDAVARPLLVVAPETTLLEKRTAANVTGIVITTGTVVTLATVRVALILGTYHLRRPERVETPTDNFHYSDRDRDDRDDRDRRENGTNGDERKGT